MKKLLRSTLLVLPLLFGGLVQAQCTPVDCLASLPPSGGLCTSDFLSGRVGEPYEDAISFHVTNACVEATLFDPTLTGVSIRITQLEGFTFTNLPEGLAGTTNESSYGPPSNGCASIYGTPTEAGVFPATVGILANVNAWPFSLTCGGFGPVAQNGNAITEVREITILPNPSFTGLPETACVTDADLTLTVNGTAGGTFSGPGVTGNTFSPASAGLGVHAIKYVVSAQEGAAIAPASDSLTVLVTVDAECLVVCAADAGTLTGGGVVCFENGYATLNASPDGNAVVPPGFEMLTLLSQGPDLPIMQASGYSFDVYTLDTYAIHTLVYDPNTLDLSTFEFGEVSIFELNDMLLQGGGTICGSIDVAGAAFFVEDCSGACAANAGTLSGGGVACFENDEATLTATANGNANVPAGFSTLYVLTEGAGLVIIAADANPEFTVDAEGSYTIHTLVYDETTLDLSIIEFGVTTGFDVNALLEQGGGDICASLDVIGAAFTVQECAEPCLADAGTLSGGGIACFENDQATLTATANGDTNVPAGFSTLYVLTEGAGLLIVEAGFTPEFTVDAEGSYTIHTLVYDENTLDVSIAVPGVTTGFDVNALLIQGGGDICASLDVIGAAFTVEVCAEPCLADAGTLSGAGTVCFENDEATLSATANGDTNVPAGFSTLYVLTEGVGLVIIAADANADFTVDAEGSYTIHTLVYDETTLDLSIVEFGVTTGFDVNALLVQGGGDICASLDVVGAAFTVEVCLEPCLADAGTLSGGGTACLVDGEATLSATANGDINMPAGFSMGYVLTEGAGLVVIAASLTPEFTVDAAGAYTIHTLVYDPATLDLSIVEFGVTTGFDINALLIQGGGDICASLDVNGAAFTVEECVAPCLADAGTLSGGSAVCFENDEATLIATANGDDNVPVGFSTVYVLTEGADLVIINASATPQFTVAATGTYTIHSLVYDETTLDLSTVEFGVTTGFDVNDLLVQGGGDICASLDVAGAAFEVVVCGVYCEAGSNSTSFEKIANVSMANINNSSTSTAGYEDFTSVTGDVARNSAYGITVTINDGYAEDQVLVWIDYDQNAVFTANELVYTSLIGAGPHSGNITIPVDAALGNTRMRVRLHDSSFNGNDTPCGNSNYGQVEDYTLNILEELPPCEAIAGTLTADASDCLEPGTFLTISATADGNAVVPAGYSTLYVLTQGAGLVIIDAGADAEFDVDAQGTYTIHTLVYDENTLDLSGVEFGVTTGFDVNGMLQQGGGLICASLDVAGAAFQVSFCCDAVAGTLSGGGSVCLENDEAVLTATANGDDNVPAGFSTVYALTEGAGLVIINAGATPEFTVDAAGFYTIHTLVYDETTLDLSTLEFGVTTGFDVNALLIQGGGDICASLDVTGTSFEVVVCGDYCDAGAGSTSFEKISNVTFSNIDNSSTSPAGYEDFTAIVGDVSRESAYDLTVTLDDGYSADQVLVWIDYDQNGAFTANELVYTSPLGEGPHTASITIPADAALGNTRMRVRMHDTGFGSNATPCGESDYGQVEDYTINIDLSVGMTEVVTIESSVFPNPTMGDFSVRYGADATVTMELLDMSGRLVYSAQRNTTANEVMQVQLAGRLAPGAYILRMSSDLGRSEKRIVVGN